MSRMPPISFRERERERKKKTYTNGWMKRIIYFPSQKERGKKKKMAQSSPRRRGGSGCGGEGEIGADVCGFGPHFIFVLRRELILSIRNAIELNLLAFHETVISKKFRSVFSDPTGFKRLTNPSWSSDRRHPEAAFFLRGMSDGLRRLRAKRERDHFARFLWMATAAGEARKSGLARKIRTAGCIGFLKLHRKLEFISFFIFWNEWMSALILRPAVTWLDQNRLSL